MDRPARGILSDSWAVFKEHWGPLVCAYLMLFLISQMGFTLPFMGPLYVGMCAMALAAVRGKPVRFDDLFDGFDRLKPGLIAGLILTAAALIPAMFILGWGVWRGFEAIQAGNILALQVLCVFAPVLAALPLCAAVLLYTPTFFILADGEAHWRTAMNASEKMVRSEWAAWTGLWAVLGLSHLASVMACCVPSFFVTPWMVIALALRYERQRGAMPGPGAARAAPPTPPPIPGAR